MRVMTQLDFACSGRVIRWDSDTWFNRSKLFEYSQNQTLPIFILLNEEEWTNLFRDTTLHTFLIDLGFTVLYEFTNPTHQHKVRIYVNP